MNRIYHYRFEIFFVTLMSTLFGSLFFSPTFFERIVFPILLLFNLGSGILLISRKKIISRFLLILLSIALLTLGSSFLIPNAFNEHLYIRLGTYFLFYAIITLEIIKQVWNATFVSKNVVIGLMSGYICLGLMAFFVFIAIELMTPGSFQGVLISGQELDAKRDSLMYYSFVTLLTIGYGEIIPVTSIAQKVAILTGLFGQFYIVIITAVVIEKYIQHSRKEAK